MILNELSLSLSHRESSYLFLSSLAAQLCLLHSIILFALKRTLEVIVKTLSDVWKQLQDF